MAPAKWQSRNDKGMSLSSTLKNGSQIVTVNAPRIDAASAIRFKEAMRSETMGGPDRVILEGWFRYPEKLGPDTEAYTLSHTAIEFAKRMKQWNRQD